MRIHYYILSALIALLTGCNSYSLVNSKVYDNVAIENHKTFHIVDLKMGSLPPRMDHATFECIVAAIRSQMLERGYKESANSPLLINFAVTVHDDTPLSPAGHEIVDGPYLSCTYPCYIIPQDYYLTDYYIDSGVIAGIYQQGVLTIDVVNIKEKTPLYTSSVSSILDIDGNYRDMEEIDKAVTMLFSQYPVQPVQQL